MFSQGNLKLSLNLQHTCKDLRHSGKFWFVNGWCEGAHQTFGVQAFKEGVFNQLLKQNSIVEVLGTPLSSRFFRSTNFLIRDLWRSPSASPSHWMGTQLTQESRLPNLHYLGGGGGQDRKYFTTYLRGSPVCGPHLRKLFIPKSLLLWGSQYQDLFGLSKKYKCRTQAGFPLVILVF